jgi:very-short-patch-repair endonuclease
VGQRVEMTARFPADWTPPVSGSQARLFTARQAVAAGMTYAQVRRRRETQRWVSVVGDALGLAGVRPDPWIRSQGAALTWPDAVVCLASAAALYRLPVNPGPDVHVIVPHRREGRQHLVSHRLRLESAEVTRWGIARVTTRTRTIFDCVGRLPDTQSEAVLSWAITRDLVSRDDLERAVAERARWWGNTRRRQALRDTEHGALGAGERRLHEVLRHAGITGWLADQKVWDAGGLIGRADLLFPAVNLIVEMDGEAYHGADRFQSDRTRQNRLVNAGYTVLRFTWADVTTRPGYVADQVRRALARLAAA